MGSNEFYREERPVRRQRVQGFWIDPHPVTNAEFRKFVGTTGYVTTCERPPDPAMYPDADPSLLVPGSSVFQKPAGPVNLRDNREWWEYVPGADWQHPQGPGSRIEGRDDHPVVHVTYEDACTYAAWAGKELPVESEWEFAARGGLDGATYAWGEAFAPQGRAMANTWQGRFPWENLQLDGYEGTSPVDAFPANGYGLYDMIGNVWEWTASSLHFARRRNIRKILLRAERARRCGRSPRGERRLTPVRAQLLLALPASSAARRGGRHVDLPHWLSLRRNARLKLVLI